MVDKLLPMLTRIKWLVLRLNWNNEEAARRLTNPVLYISGESETQTEAGTLPTLAPPETLCWCLLAFGYYLSKADRQLSWLR